MKPTHHEMLMEDLNWDKPDEIVETILQLEWRLNVANAKIAELTERLEAIEDLSSDATAVGIATAALTRKTIDFDPYDPA